MYFYFTYTLFVSVFLLCSKRNAGSSSDGTEDSDFSADLEHTDSSENDAHRRRNTRLTRASLRLSQSSQGIVFLRN